MNQKYNATLAKICQNFVLMMSTYIQNYMHFLPYTTRPPPASLVFSGSNLGCQVNLWISQTNLFGCQSILSKVFDRDRSNAQRI